MKRFVATIVRHREERSDVAIQDGAETLDCFASLAMTATVIRRDLPAKSASPDCPAPPHPAPAKLGFASLSLLNPLPPIGGRGQGEGGVALIVVVWVLALLTVLILGFTGGAHTELLLARNNYESARAAALADAGVSLAVLGVLDTASDAQWPADGRERTLSFGDGTMLVRVQDEAGKVDLNNAPDELLAGLFTSLGLGASDGAGLAVSIVDWRTRRKPLAAQDGGGDAAEEHGAFLSIEELRLVPGITRAIYDRVEPFVTVYAPIGRIDPTTAPAEVLRALPGIDPKQLDAFLAARDALGAVPGALPPLSGVTRFLAHAALHAATIRSVGQTSTGTRFIREAVLVINGQPNQPYQFAAWRQGRDEDAEDTR